MPRKKKCSICGTKHRYPNKAHVKDESSLIKEHPDWRFNTEKTRYRNIIVLCPNCHNSDFDAGRVGIDPDKRKFIIYKGEKGGIKISNPKVSINNIKAEYIKWKNERCHPAIMANLGLIPGLPNYRL